MFGLGLPELLILFIVVLLVFGPSRLPQLGQAIGRTIKGFRKGMQDGSGLETRKAAPSAVS